LFVDLVVTLGKMSDVSYHQLHAESV